MSDFEIKVPDLGTTEDEVTVLRWLVEAGGSVQLGQPLLEVETDKATVEVEAVVAGTLKQIVVGEGQSVGTGALLAVVDTSTATAASSYDEFLKPSAAVTSIRQDTISPQALGTLFHSSRTPAATSGAEPAELPAELIDASDYDRQWLLDRYATMVLIRVYEERVKRLFLAGSMPGTIHQCQGQEACAVGVCSALRQDDFITSTFRGTGHVLAKGLSVEDLLFEQNGALTGCCRGKGGSMHFGSFRKGMIPGIAIVGGGVPLAAGMALAYKMQNTSQVVACFFGDGAVAEGAFHEGINLAAIWDLPAIFVCENNHYGASTRIDKVMRTDHVADRAAGYGVVGRTVDGNDVLAVYEAAQQAVDECRAGNGPVLLELLTYRRTGHSRRDVCNYQSQEEQEFWFSRDPIGMFGQRIISRGDVTESDLEQLHEQAEKQFDDAHAKLPLQPMPDVAELMTDVWA